MSTGSFENGKAISLDLHATTPTAREVIAAMAPFWSERAWNAHSAHAGGADAAQAVAEARIRVAHLIGALSSEIVFTAGATEANNIAILGVAAAAKDELPQRTRILTSAIEHKCVLEAAHHLSESGFEHELIPVDSQGIVDLKSLADMIDDRVLLVAVMAANNEVGTCQPLAEVARLCESRGALFHVDAAQAVGKVAFDVDEIGCDFASVSAHKFYGPKGIGALYVSAAASMRPKPIMFGGGQEGSLRPGTLPVPLIVGMGCAAELALGRLGQGARLKALAAQFMVELRRNGIEARINGDEMRRLPGSLNFRIPGIDAEEVVQRLGNDLHLSTGSACQSGQLHGSYVLSAMGLSQADVSSSFRACFGYEHSDGDALLAASLLAETLKSCQNRTG